MSGDVARKLINGVVVIGVRAADGEINAMTASWVTRACDDPPAVMVGLGKKSYTRELIE